MERKLEKEVMDQPEQVKAYAQADFSEPNSFFVELFLTQAYDHTTSHVIDLGCGPADIPLRLLRVEPRLTITAVDASPAMLAIAKANLSTTGLAGRSRLLAARLPDSGLRSHCCDALISNSLLHHLRNPLAFWRESRRLVCPGGALLVMDLLRPRSTEQARDLVDRYASGEPEMLCRDFYNSLLASFTLSEISDQLSGLNLGLKAKQVSNRHWAAFGKI